MSESRETWDYDNVGGNFYDKYNTRNPVARKLMTGFLGAFDDLSGQAGPKTVFEVGCGEGHLSMRLLEDGMTVTGCDIDDDVIDVANRAAHRLGHGRPFRVQSLYDIDPVRNRADLVVCCEVMEHLPVSSLALEKLAALARPYLLVSVPREPIWRVLNMLRGKYLAQLGNTPGHIQHWSARAFIDMLGEHFDIVAVRQPLPWTMVLCKIRGPSVGG